MSFFVSFRFSFDTCSTQKVKEALSVKNVASKATKKCLPGTWYTLFAARGLTHIACCAPLALVSSYV